MFTILSDISPYHRGILAHPRETKRQAPLMYERLGILLVGDAGILLTPFHFVLPWAASKGRSKPGRSAARRQAEPSISYSRTRVEEPRLPAGRAYTEIEKIF